MPDNQMKLPVVVHYSREPREDAQFATALADRLRRAGFEVRLNGAGQGTAEPGNALYIVTKAWLERTGSRAEIAATGGQPAGTLRRLAVCREPIDDRTLAAQLAGLPSVEWLPDDPDPDARFWEVYCGLTKTPPGDPAGWAGRGRDLLGGRQPGAIEETALVECPSRPVLARPFRGGTLLLTDSATCFHLDRGGPFQLRPLPDLDGCSSVAVDGSGKLLVGLYDGMVATLNLDEWSYHPAEAPVLSLATTARYLALGDAAGSVTFRDPPGTAVGSAMLGEPVVDLIAFDDGVVALGARGGLWRVGPPEGGKLAVTPVPPNEAMGRPVGLFETGDPAKAGVFGAARLALLDRGGRSLKVGIRRFPEGIGSVVAFGRGGDSTGPPPIGLLTDAGQVWAVDADLKAVAPVVLQDAPGEVVGIAAGVDGGLLGWTSGGTVFAIGRDRSSRTLASGDVALALADPDQPDRVDVVHWSRERGVQVRRLRPLPAR
jgi:hypothetical protein